MAAMRPDWVHVQGDGRGPRDVYVNGLPVKMAIFADTKKGVVKYLDDPVKLDKYGKRFIHRTARGKVVVVPNGS